MKPNVYRRLVKLEDVVISTTLFKITWLESPLGFIAETSFGRCHISKVYKELTVYSPTGTNVIWKSIKDVKILKQKAQELHERTISKSQMYIHNQIKVK